MPPTWSQTVDQVFTSTWMKRRDTATQQAFLKTPFIYWLMEAKRIDPVTGYTRIEIPVEYGSNDTVRWLGKGGTIPISDPELITMAYEDWKYVAVSIVRYMVDDQKNRGKAALIKLIDRKLGAAERSLYEEFERVFLEESAPAALEPNSIQELIATAPTTGTVHGLNRATYAWWRNQTKTATGAASVYLESDMRNLFNTCTKYAKAEMRDYVILTDQTSFELYEDEFGERHRIVETNPNSASLGFDTIRFKGRPLFWSPSAPAGEMRFINTNHIRLTMDKDYWMEMTEWKPIPNQVKDRVAQIMCACNMTGDRFAPQGVLHTIAA